MGIASLPVGVLAKKAPQDVVYKIALRGVFPQDVPTIWDWMNEYPRSHMDDYGPQNIEEFTSSLATRIEQKELVLSVLCNGELVGYIGYAAITERLGLIRAICFGKEFHGRGIAYASMCRFLSKLFQQGQVEKVFATYFQDNSHAKKFLKRLGFVHEGTFTEETKRAGALTTVTRVALFTRDFKGMNQ
jgi:RimJ/RimL family protein N-acetyltransferase